ncbi:hypothetical protein [Amycolatopsis sp. CA-230715]|uniref:hypothetical protein n=1 Tax=Amycolatopsis sp. CA-230715 TaxID=2745196 RepID=UPI001C0254AD|nr:hypothetical protein [Amycolatopsis sp. CA-230715]QWF78989.1 hypothetical protein HUW46_02390 [Amycolatopsis sp. CA-230715]
MDGTGGFHVGEDAYGSYARAIDPLGDEVRGAAGKHLAPHSSIGGDGFGEVGDESGLHEAYSSRMRGLQERIQQAGGNWHGMADASRRTEGNYAAVEDDHKRVLKTLGQDLA